MFFAAYAVRKLAEARKLSDEVEGHAIKGWAYPGTGKPVHLRNWDRLTELYDLSEPKSIQLSLTDFCNQFIHSFVFMVGMTESGGLQGFYVASDRVREKRLLYFELNEITTALGKVVNDDIVWSSSFRAPSSSTGWSIKKSNRHPSAQRPDMPHTS